MSVDSLDVKITSDAESASIALDKLASKLTAVKQSLGNLNQSGLSSFVNDINTLSQAMSGLSAVKMPDYNRLANGIMKVASIDTAQITSAGNALTALAQNLQSLNNTNIGTVASQLGEFAKGVAQLGYKSSTQAIQNIPQLATAMRDLMATLSTAPKVSQNVIDLTNALAKLARTGSSSGKAANSLRDSLNGYSKSAKTAKSHTFSLASAVGKLYASYWMLIRAFNLLKKAIDLSSDLTEVQNVVDKTFGAYTGAVEDMASTSIADYGMSELTVKKIARRFQAMGTALGFAQGKMSNMSVELTELTADMASFYNVSHEDVAEDLESIFTGTTKPMRAYGIDLTEATLKEWALTQGLNSNIDAMTQAEKALLRYQYVMAQTGVAQGDFVDQSGRLCAA